MIINQKTVLYYTIFETFLDSLEITIEWYSYLSFIYAWITNICTQNMGINIHFKKCFLLWIQFAIMWHVCNARDFPSLWLLIFKGILIELGFIRRIHTRRISRLEGLAL